MKFYYTPEKINGAFKIKAFQNGAYATSKLSKKAQEFYLGADSLQVYEFQDCEANIYYYSVRGDFGYYDNLTFAELEQLFEELADAYNEE